MKKTAKASGAPTSAWRDENHNEALSATSPEVPTKRGGKTTTRREANLKTKHVLLRGRVSALCCVWRVHDLPHRPSRSADGGSGITEVFQRQRRLANGG